MKAIVGLFLAEPLSLLEISEDPDAIASAARAMLKDLPVAADDAFTMGRYDVLRRLAGPKKGD